MTNEINIPVGNFDMTIIYGVKLSDDREGLFIKPDRWRNPDLLHLLPSFGSGMIAQGISDERIQQVVHSVCQICPVFAVCKPEYIKRAGLTDAKLTGTQTRSDHCALGIRGGGFIAAEYFRS
ncbi:hypothetical protein A2774_04750 [Candidatus Roizmanbacteria bacterium RIFCSPHIGHO2_01_FULL_39_12c]|uniref:Uncharacterized protein n=1 Tax=Candidatus Roizmanbacteria bacterium RIFCSPHIGHO2_01_FULL_39_12c TaxID=1802031 RepID=A0A1F7GF72_9BACT|nr:MAG: hypothetical protein A2774_04750 [Candidatus Roizmanbacteria bacterium RIFCSPHIGHO2_01_FULL_39_12c]OGK46238.1 MAG: hypothetical protein A2963_02105 [Candidatus Roizmanbacteria bacterium RIFCSPLOWO2_01_FULL_40_13]